MAADQEFLGTAIGVKQRRKLPHINLKIRVGLDIDCVYKKLEGQKPTFIQRTTDSLRISNRRGTVIGVKQKQPHIN